MNNQTVNSPVLQLEGLIVPEQYLYPTFLFLLVVYLIIMVINMGIILLISVERGLHEPMYILYCNLPFNDVFGNSIIFPRLMLDILRPSSERYINYIDCVTQAFCYQLYASAAHTILMVMAFDRYVAICKPLHYTTIMTPRMVAKLTAAAWGSVFVFVSVLLSLTIRLNLCGTFIANPFCDNASVFKLACESTSINNIYGLTYTGILLGSSMLCIVLTYSKITEVCLSTKSKTLNNKALKTCSTHLTVYLIMYVSGLTRITLHRIPAYSEYRKGVGLLFHIVPGILNPAIYALQSSELRHVMLKILHSKKVMP